MLDELLGRVAVIGAAGKMGRGIALLLLEEMARLRARSGGAFKLQLIDSSAEALDTLRPYFREHLAKFAERNINQLRAWYASNADLVDNADMIAAFVEGGLDMVDTNTQVHAAADAHLVFEAIVEDVDAKATLYKELREIARAVPAYYFTNTSSIPVSVLDKKARLGHRIIGFHFYNPPPVQKLVEVITGADTDPALHALALELGKRLGKTLVPSNDIAGFIGNGHFIREISYACEQAMEIAGPRSREQAITMMDRVTRAFMLRPMGIFQLMDYVGLDVCRKIIGVMAEHTPGAAFSTELIDQMLATGVRAGQHPDGSQRDGFFQYKDGVPAAVYSLERSTYAALENEACDRALGALPEGCAPWRGLVKDPARAARMTTYFGNLFREKTMGAKFAQAFLLKSRDIAQGLVHDGVARSTEDVNAVLQLGFAHLYGPVNDYY
ncbi:MAG TPA: 3-hydroxyacyl-CoA dehydrogenase family protein [Kiritimatiellia bacterium]